MAFHADGGILENVHVRGVGDASQGSTAGHINRKGTELPAALFGDHIVSRTGRQAGTLLGCFSKRGENGNGAEQAGKHNHCHGPEKLHHKTQDSYTHSV